MTCRTTWCRHGRFSRSFFPAFEKRKSMLLRPFVKSLFPASRKDKTQPRKCCRAGSETSPGGRGRRRLGIELLEDRVVPSMTVVIDASSADPSSWTISGDGDGNDRAFFGTAFTTEWVQPLA